MASCNDCEHLRSDQRCAYGFVPEEDGDMKILCDGFQQVNLIIPIDSGNPVGVIKHDQGKPDMTLIDPEFLESMACVLMDGAADYGRNNWQEPDFSDQRYVAAIKRHLAAIEKGEFMDPKSKKPHTAHIACSCMFLQWHRKRASGHRDLPWAQPKSVEDLQREIAGWADTIFPDRTVDNALTKLVMEEIPEVLQRKDDPDEFADILILVLDAAHLAGVNIFDAVEKKMTINRSRNWKKQPNGLMRHTEEEV